MNVAQEPFVDFRIFVHVFDAPAALECFADMEQAGEIRADQFRAELSVAQTGIFIVLAVDSEPGAPGLKGAERFLERLFEVSADGHG